MSTLDDWMEEVTQTLALPPAQMPADLRNELLDLTRDVAHNVARVAGPLTCYLVGIAIGRGAAPTPAITALAELARARGESAPEPAAPTEKS